jgi:hypothetical protein
MLCKIRTVHSCCWKESSADVYTPEHHFIISHYWRREKKKKKKFCFKVIKIVTKMYNILWYTYSDAVLWCPRIFQLYSRHCQQSIWEICYIGKPSISYSAEITNCFHQLLYDILEMTESHIGRWVQCVKKCLSRILTQGLCRINVRLVPQKPT